MRPADAHAAGGLWGAWLPPKTADNIRMRLYRVFHQTRREHVEEVPSRQAVGEANLRAEGRDLPASPEWVVAPTPQAPIQHRGICRALSTVSFALTILPPHLSSPFKTTRPLSRLRSSVLGAPARILVPAPLHAYHLSPSGFCPSSTTPSSRSSTLTTTAGRSPTSIPEYQFYIMAHSPRAHRILTLSWTCYTIDLFEMLRFSRSMPGSSLMKIRLCHYGAIAYVVEYFHHSSPQLAHSSPFSLFSWPRFPIPRLSSVRITSYRPRLNGSYFPRHSSLIRHPNPSTPFISPNPLRPSFPATTVLSIRPRAIHSVALMTRPY